MRRTEGNITMITNILRNSTSRRTHGNNCRFQTTRWQSVFRILCRTGKRRQSAGYCRDSGMVGLERSDYKEWPTGWHKLGMGALVPDLYRGKVSLEAKDG